MWESNVHIKQQTEIIFPICFAQTMEEWAEKQKPLISISFNCNLNSQMVTKLHLVSLLLCVIVSPELELSIHHLMQK